MYSRSNARTASFSRRPLICVLVSITAVPFVACLDGLWRPRGKSASHLERRCFRLRHSWREWLAFEVRNLHANENKAVAERADGSSMENFEDSFPEREPSGLNGLLIVRSSLGLLLISRKGAPIEVSPITDLTNRLPDQANRDSKASSFRNPSVHPSASRSLHSVMNSDQLWNKQKQNKEELDLAGFLA
jgi:hypothetical protein